MQPSEEGQGQSVVLASHSGLGFVAVHVGKVSVKFNTTELSAAFCGQTTQSYSHD